MKKRLLLLFLIFLVVTLFLVVLLNNTDKNVSDSEESNVELIKKHYNQYVKTNKDSKLYKIIDDEYVECGNISKNVSVELEKLDENSEYFLIKNLNLYILFTDVDIIESIELDDRYKNYIPFNENIKTISKTNFYDLDGNLMFTINNSFDFEVIVKVENYYGIVYNNSLLYINSGDVEEVYENINSDKTNKNKIRTLTYHFIYDPNVTTCNQDICQSLDLFESHLKYISENNYFSLTLSELDLYLNGSLQIPEKSIVLTVDDGTLFDSKAIDLLEKYKVNMTMFVVTSWIDISNFNSNYLDFESHTDNMHNQYECPGYGSQGGGILCKDDEYVLNDLKTSREKLGGSKYFAYPFFDFNERAINLLKEAGFNMAFIGQYNTDGYSYPKKTNKYKVPRKTIFSDISEEEFISYLN